MSKRPKPPPRPPHPKPPRPVSPVGPATLNIFSEVLARSDVSRAQILTLLEAKGLPGNYRLVVLAATLVPQEGDDATT